MGETASGRERRAIEKRPLRIATLAGLAIALSTHAAAATPDGRIELVWNGVTPACLDARLLASLVEGALGKPVFHRKGPTIARVEGRIERRAEGGYRAAIRVRGLPNEAVLSYRTIETDADDCRRLDESAAVVVALMIDELASNPSVLAIPARPPRERVVEEEAVGAGVGVSTGLTPGVAAMPYARVDVLPTPVGALSLSARVWLPTKSLDRSVGGRYWAWALLPGLCPEWGARDSWTGGLCMAGGPAMVHASAVDLNEATDATSTFALLSAGGFTRIKLWRSLWLRVDATGDIPLARPRTWITEPDGSARILHTTAAFVPSVSAGLEVRAGP